MFNSAPNNEENTKMTREIAEETGEKNKQLLRIIEDSIQNTQSMRKIGRINTSLNKDVIVN